MKIIIVIIFGAISPSPTSNTFQTPGEVCLTLLEPVRQIPGPELGEVGNGILSCVRRPRDLTHSDAAAPTSWREACSISAHPELSNEGSKALSANSNCARLFVMHLSGFFQ